MMITLSGGHLFDRVRGRKAWAFSAQITKIFPPRHRATEEYIRGIFVDPRYRWGAGESTTETQSAFLPHCGIRAGRRDGRRGDRSPNLAAERKQRYTCTRGALNTEDPKKPKSPLIRANGAR